MLPCLSVRDVTSFKEEQDLLAAHQDVMSKKKLPAEEIINSFSTISAENPLI